MLSRPPALLPLALAGLVWLLAGGLSAQVGGEAGRLARAKLSARLAAEEALVGPNEGLAVRVVLREQGLPPQRALRRARVADRQQRVIAAMAGAGLEVRRRHRSLAGFAAVIPARRLEALARHPDVVSIHTDEMVYPALAQGSVLVGARQVQAAGFTGQGINVAVLDSGIDTDHPNLSDDLVAEFCSCVTSPFPFAGGCCPNGQTTQTGPGAAESTDGHGTSVAGIITSNHATYTGVAPDAGIVAVKVLADGGGALESSIDGGLDWVLTNHLTYGIRVVNMSLGDSGQYEDPDDRECSSDPTSVAIAALHAQGVAVFVASGNNGWDEGISAPACTEEAISVGGVYDQAMGNISWCGSGGCSTVLCTDATGPDVFVCHTNSAEILDLVAPDFRTHTPGAGGLIDPAFAGTSAASPYAAGQAALLLEADPSLTPEELRSLLTSHGPLVTNPDNGLSFRRSDVHAALVSLTCGNGVVDAHEACDSSGGSACCTPSCAFESAGALCDDGSICTSADACDGAGTCAGMPLVCDDSNICTDDVCDPVLGCSSTNNVAVCDDGNACTTGEICSEGSCGAGAPVLCDDANLCTDDSCDPSSGCAFVPNTGSCDDENACTTGDVCAGGSCAGASVFCDDVNLCTDDSCDPASGCVFVPNTVSCDDGDVCTDGDVCSGGSCVGAPVLCNDGNPCTAEGCDALTGCFHSPIPGCSFSVPASSGWSRGGLLLCVAFVAGAALLAARRCRISDPER